MNLVSGKRKSALREETIMLLTMLPAREQLPPHQCKLALLIQ